MSVSAPERGGSSTYWAEHAWLSAEAGTRHGVLIEIEAGRFTAVRDGVTAPPAGATRLAGLTLPGLANAHSHAFHRALRGRTHAGKGTFWTWRERMYDLAARLTPEAYHALARATFAEMAHAGVTCVGEFHYLHHGPGGTRYADANEMGHRLITAAAEAGIRITLLDTLYLTADVDGAPLSGAQLRFSDGDLTGWWSRVQELRTPPHARTGAAAHSVRAVPAGLLAEFASCTGDLSVHIHLSEQRRENEACLAVHGRTPTQLLVENGLAGPSVTAVHATHLTDDDRTALGDTGTRVCLCPTTERDLADGIGPARALADAGSSLCLGSDSHAVIDLFEEARAVELDERLRDEHRGHFDVAELLTAATVAGHASLGWDDAGTIAAGARADLVTVRLDTVRTAGCDLDQAPAAAVFAASAADVHHVVVDGREIVRDGVHLLVDDVGRALDESIRAAWA
ncbi:MAG TPA: formimidoylglutamate deiminase [Micromonosporaceae bacterium]|nr:formimidoylglutamate deiminase [Micromonosporaceae bacterium]